MDIQTQNLIKELAEQPAHNSFSVNKFFFTVMVVTLIYMAGVLSYLGLRSDINTILQSSVFMTEMLVTLSLAAISGFATFRLALPDGAARSFWIYTSYTLLIMFVGLMLVLGTMDIIQNGWGHLHLNECIWHALFLFTIPIAVWVFALRAGASTHPRLMAFMATLCVSSLGWIVLRLSCSDDSALHCYGAHLIPFILAGGVFAYFSRHLFRW